MKTFELRLRQLALLCLVAALPLAVLSQASVCTAAEEEPCNQTQADKDAIKDGETAPDDEEKPDPLMQSTHAQTGTISIPMGDQTAAIHNFCIDGKGNLLATCGGERAVLKREDGVIKVEMVNEPSAVRVISPEGELVAQWSLKTTPQSIGVGKDGSVYCGGKGVLVKLDADGKILKTVDSPQVAELPPLPTIEDIENIPEPTEEEKKANEEKIAELKEQLDEGLQEIREIQTERLEAVDNEERAQIDARLEKAIKAYQDAAMQHRALVIDPRTLAFQKRSSAMRKRAVTGIAVSDKDLFVACPAAKSYGYDVWRMNLDMTEPKKIVSGLRGCCGQMDIQAADDKLLVAENARKRVVCYDREGEELSSWGSGNKFAPDGFGSCCNPMNTWFGADGSVYTSESNVGRVKKFSPEGEFQGIVGTVTIVPGCKRVPIGVSKDGKKVFMLDITRSHIVVMEKGAKVEDEQAM